MGVFYNPQGQMPLSQMGFQTQISGVSAMSRGPKKGRDIAAEKWDKEQADERKFDAILASSTNKDTGEIDYKGASKALRLSGLAKEADVAEEQYIKTSKARLDMKQEDEMQALNDTAQAYQLVTSGSRHLAKIGLGYLQQQDPDLVDVQPADKDGYFYNEVRSDGTVNKVSAEKVWNSLVSAKDLLTMKQADDQFRFKLTEESKRWSVDQLKALSLAKKARIDSKKFRGEQLNPNDLADVMTETDLKNVEDIYGQDIYLKTVYDIETKNPMFAVKAMRDPLGVQQDLANKANILREAQKKLSEEKAPVAPSGKGKGDAIPKETPTKKVEVSGGSKAKGFTPPAGVKRFKDTKTGKEVYTVDGKRYFDSETGERVE